MERTYTIPLRREWIKTVAYRRGKKTISAIREFITRHMKASDVKIGKHLNEHVWKNSIRNPPPRVRVNASKDKDGVVTVELFGVQKDVEKSSKKAAAKKSSDNPEQAKSSEQDKQKEESAPKKKAVKKAAVQKSDAPNAQPSADSTQ